MSDAVVARRYAQALFELGEEKNLLDVFAADLQEVVGAIETSDQLREVIGHHQLSKKTKKQVLRDLFAERIHPLSLNFLMLAIDKSREQHISAVYRCFLELRDRAENVQEVEVRSAIALTGEEKQTLTQTLGRLTSKKIRLKESVDPSLIAGISIKVGDRVYDGSVAGRLRSLKGHLQSIPLASKVDNMRKEVN